MNEKQISAIRAAVDIIEERLKGNMDLDTLSTEVGISKYHLHHLFKSITGLSLMAYVRGRKLSASAKELISTDLHIIDIANEYQFKHEQSYTRAFRRRFGINPSQYRGSKCELPVEQKVDTNHLSALGQGLVIQPRMCLKPEFYVQGIQKEIVHSENLNTATANQLAREFQRTYLPKMKHVVDDKVYYGLVRYADKPVHSNYYIPSVEVESPKHTEPPYVSYTIPTLEYAVFRYVGLHSPYEITFATLFELYGFLTKWIVQSSFQQAAPFHFEKMNIRTCSKTYCEMDIYVPIALAGGRSLHLS